VKREAGATADGRGKQNEEVARMADTAMVGARAPLTNGGRSPAVAASSRAKQFSNACRSTSKNKNARNPAQEAAHRL